MCAPLSAWRHTERSGASKMPFVTRRTKIVCTIGPATSSPVMLRQLILAGMDVARLNFSHGTHAEHARVIADLRAICGELGANIAILQDLQGPKIRTGELREHRAVILVDGNHITITTRPLIGDEQTLSTTYGDLPNDVHGGDRILLADGLIELRVDAVVPPEIHCTIVHGGQLDEHQGINLPGVAISAPALTAKDREDLAFGVAQGVDLIALSFVRKPEDVDDAHAAVLAAQTAIGSATAPIPIIVKLEKPEAIDRLDEVLAKSDGVMVARGDLGVEMPLEEVPLIQKRIIRRANALGLPVITATQMLESMIDHPRPTRAEVSDVANAILDGTDAVMLSGETAVGRFPIAAVQMMVRIALETESHGTLPPAPMREHSSPKHAISFTARTLAEQTPVRGIIVFTRSGISANLISKERPRVPILAVTLDETVRRRLALWWGVQTMHADLLGSTEDLIAWVDTVLMTQGFAARGDYVVLMGGMPVARQAPTNFVKLHHVGQV